MLNLYKDLRSPYRTQLGEEGVTLNPIVYANYELDVKPAEMASLSYENGIAHTVAARLTKSGTIKNDARPPNFEPLSTMTISLYPDRLMEEDVKARLGLFVWILFGPIYRVHCS